MSPDDRAHLFAVGTIVGVAILFGIVKVAYIIHTCGFSGLFVHCVQVSQ